MTSVQDRLVSLVSTPPQLRRDVDIEIVIPWLKKKSELLQKLDKDILKDVIRNCGYQKNVKDDVVITQGEMGDCFYIMLTGRMSVFIDTARSDEEEPINSEDGKKQAQGFGGVADDDGDRFGLEDRHSRGVKKPLNRSKFGKFIMFFEAGKSFGEIALISDNCVRNASIIADMESDLLVIHRDLFNTYMKASQVAEYEEKKNFVDSCHFFHSWSAKFRGLLEMSLRKEVYPYGTVIVQQGEPVVGLVFILSGQAKLMMEPAKHENQYPELMGKKKGKNKKPDPGEKPDPPPKHREVPLRTPQVGVRRKMGYAAAERRIMSKSVDVCCIEKDEIIGDLEMVLDLETNSETVVSTASTSVLILNPKNFDRLVAKKHQFTITRLAQWAHKKISTRAHSSKGSLIPLLKYVETKLEEKIPKPPPPAKRVEILRQKEVVMNQLLEMFLDDKVPLIEPCVPNALFYRQRSANKNKLLMQNPYAKLRTLKHIEDYGKIRRKVPRSIQQLKNNVKAERELMKDDRREVVEDDVLGGHGRPMTSTGFSHHRSSTSPRMPRPSTHHSLRITECRQEDDSYSYSHSEYHPDKADQLDRETVAEIYDELEIVSRETQENRMRLLCTMSAKQELMAQLERSGSRGALNSNYSNPQEQEAFDWETGETNLRDLENRLERFCRTVSPGRPSSAVSRPNTAGQIVTKMKRFEIENPSVVPLPGGTVFVHKKPCRFSKSASSSNSSVHKHVRRFILSRDDTLFWKGNTPAATPVNYY